MRPKVLITQKIFDEAVALVKKHFEVDYNPSDAPLPPPLLVKRLQGKKGAITLLTDPIDETLLSQCPELKIVSNVAVGYNNIDVEACTRRKVMVTNTPGVLDDTTADFTWTLILATARRLVESDTFLRSSQVEGMGTDGVSGPRCPPQSPWHLRPGANWSGCCAAGRGI